MSFTLIGKHEKDSRNNRDGLRYAMLEPDGEGQQGYAC